MKAYITLLSSRNYLPGVFALANSLRMVKSAYPLVCALSKGIGTEVEKDLDCQGIKCIRLNEDVVRPDANPEKAAFSHWNFTFDKLLVWGLNDFEKLVFLDSDMTRAVKSTNTCLTSLSGRITTNPELRLFQLSFPG